MRGRREGRDAEPETRDRDDHRWDPEDRAAYDAMRKARAKIAEDLDLDPGVVCPSRPLWRAVASRPADADELCATAELRPWQIELLRDVLWDAYTATMQPGDGPAPEDTTAG
jgi:ribonuclease D